MESRLGKLWLHGFMLVLLAVTMFGSKSVYGFFAGKTHVHVFNNIEPKTKFTLNCRSKEDRLGEHTLNYGEDLHWEFQTNYFDTTLYWCNMWWNDKNGREVKGGFQMYVAKRDEELCYHHCRYYVKADGIYLQNTVKKRMDLMYKWPQ